MSRVYRHTRSEGCVCRILPSTLHCGCPGTLACFPSEQKAAFSRNLPSWKYQKEILCPSSFTFLPNSTPHTCSYLIISQSLAYCYIKKKVSERGFEFSAQLCCTGGNLQVFLEWLTPQTPQAGFVTEVTLLVCLVTVTTSSDTRKILYPGKSKTVKISKPGKGLEAHQLRQVWWSLLYDLIWNSGVFIIFGFVFKDED